MNRGMDNVSPMKAGLGAAGERIVTTQRRRMMDNSTTLDVMPQSVRVDQYISNIKDMAPPFAEAGKYGGAKFNPSNKDYGNFPDTKRIDEILNNMRQIRQI